jgi:hypothetical protein
MHVSRIYPVLLIFLFFFNFQAQIFGQCTETEVTITSVVDMYPGEVQWELYDSLGEIIATFQGSEDVETTETILCIPYGCYLFKAIDTYGDGWNGAYVEMTWEDSYRGFGLPEGEENSFDFGINQVGCTPIVPGCINPTAFNYDILATEDDGSCQLLSEVVASQIVDTLCYSGPKDNRINWVIQNRTEADPGNNYTGPEDLSNLLNEHWVSRFTTGNPVAQTPYAQYKDFFNLYAAWWPDAPGDHTWWSWDVLKSTRDEMFLPWANDETGWVTWFSVSRYGGGGGAGVQREARTGDGKMWGADDYETLFHEFAHTMPGLPDEYTASGEWSGGDCWESGNSTGYAIKDSIPWRKWIEEDTELPTPYDGSNEDKIGAFEGALTNYFGCHRPTAKGCYMGAGGFGEGYGRDLCSPCVQRVICALYQYVNVIENPTPANPDLSVTGAETITFSADVIAPTPNTQKYEWFLNGKLVAENVTTVDLTFGPCDNNELKFSVTDTTDLVRYDEKFAEIYPKPYREFIWNIQQEDVSSYDLSSNSIVTDASCTGENNGAVEFSFVGGAAPYELWSAGTLIGNPAVGLAPSSHLFIVVDANGCSISQSVQINQVDRLDLEICSDKSGTWEVTLSSENYDVTSLDLQWSTGATTPVINGLLDGSYSVTATVNGCSISEDFELISAPDALSISEQFFPSEQDGNTGAIYIEVIGGAPIYKIEWYENLDSDPTGQFGYNAEFDGQFSRSNLASGEYRYEVSDLSSACAEANIIIENHNVFAASGLTVTQDDNCGVTVENPDANYEYYWLSDEQGSTLLGSGVSFVPPAAGNYYVAAANTTTNGWSNNRKGFAVTMPDSPQIEDLGDGTLAVLNPQPNEDYRWYDEDLCGAPIHVGNEFTPTNSGQYFISAQSNIERPDPIDPTSISGLILQMDAADLNGDGAIDDPAPQTSSILDWYFPTGNNWNPDTWFAYRSNNQNGLGIADWATIWLQAINAQQANIQTVIMAYEENELSWEDTAPLEVLSSLIPRHTDASQIYSNAAPATTLNGITYLDGQEVNPLTTPNPMQFCVLGSTFTTSTNQEIRYTDMHWEGKVGELLFYNGALSNVEMQGVSEYLRQKWISTAELESPRTPFQYGTVATEEVENKLQLSLSPNPATDFIHLKSNTLESLRADIFDVQGRLVLSKSSFVSNVKIDVSGWISGLYHVVIFDAENNRKTLRFVKL